MIEQNTPKLYGFKDTALDLFVNSALGKDYFDLVKSIEFHEFDLDEVQVDNYEVRFEFSRRGIASLGDFSFGKEILSKIDRVYVSTELNQEDGKPDITMRLVITVRLGQKAPVEVTKNAGTQRNNGLSQECQGHARDRGRLGRAFRPERDGIGARGAGCRVDTAKPRECAANTTGLAHVVPWR